jgi:trk system potassium uptake protein
VKIIILGAGQVGRTAAYHLSREEANEVTVVDSNDAVLRDLQDRLDVRTVSGNAANPAVLEAAGCADANLLVALTSSDEVNMVACHVAWTLFKTPTKIARIRDAAYGARPELFSDSAGFAVDVWVSPEQLVTEYVEQLIRHPGALQVVDFADGRVRLVGLRAVQGGLLVGQPLSNLPRHIPDVDARVAAIYRKGRSIKPEGSTVIEPGDEVFFLAAREDIRVVMSELRKLEGPIKRLVIAGGGNIGIRLAQALEVQNQVKLIERDPRRARYASEVLRNTIVLQGDAADEELLLEENIDSADAFVAVTNAEEANILSAMLAKRLGCHKVMALINKPSYAELMEGDRIDIAISPQTITIGSLLAYVRRGDVARVHSLRRGAAEAIEAIAHGDSETSKVVGRAVEAIKLPEGTTIGAVVRGDEVIMGHHDTVITEGDHVILFLTDRRHVEAVEKLFQAGVSFI